MKNPKWHRDEIILALDLYFDPQRGTIDASNPKVIALSKILNTLPIFVNRPDEERFRNANGVSLKLSNFLAIDPAHEGKGMSAYSKLDEEVFHEFVDDRIKLHKLANEIKTIVKDAALSIMIAKIEDDENSERDSVKEGQVIYKLHKLRERDKKIVANKKKKVMKEKGELACEVCNFNFLTRYGKIGEGFIECHHIVPLANFDVSKKTKQDDLALVCSNCHRMLHRNIGMKELKEYIQIR